MSFAANKYKQKAGIIAVVVLLFLAVTGVAGAVYLNDYYPADVNAMETFMSDKEMEGITLQDETIIWEPEDAKKGLIFYPGGKVDHRAYIPLMQACAEQGILCVLVEMPFRLAVFDIKAADGIQERYPKIQEWYLGGHSLGGSMAASYLAEHTEDYEGLILLGSYSTADLSETDIRVLSVYGSEDQVMNRENYEKNKSNLPEGFTENVIEGGCHAYFGMYGEQEGDGTPTISCGEQIRQTAAEIGNLVDAEK